MNFAHVLWNKEGVEEEDKSVHEKACASNFVQNYLGGIQVVSDLTAYFVFNSLQR
jgi:hypothetical protein